LKTVIFLVFLYYYEELDMGSIAIMWLETSLIITFMCCITGYVVYSNNRSDNEIRAFEKANGVKILN